MTDLTTFDYFIQIGAGVGFTLLLLFGSLIVGVFLGTLLSILRYKNIATPIINAFISVIRGTPLILQLSFIFFAVPQLINMPFSIMTAGIITFGINSSAYVAEIIRSGIESIPKGQFEAARTLNVPEVYTWRDIIFPQVIRNIFPALVNEVIALLKETAIISVIGGLDIMRKAEIVTSTQFTYFMPLCVAGFYYYILVMIIAIVGKKIEKRYYYA